MKLRTLAKIAAALPALLLLPSPSSAAALPEGSSGRDLTVVASGTVASAGVGLPGAHVTVFAEPSTQALDLAGGTGVRMLPLGQTSADRRGGFVVRADVSSVPTAYRSPTNAVDVLVVVEDASRSLSWMYTLQPEGTPVGRGGVVAPAPGAAVGPDGHVSGRAVGPMTSFDLADGSVGQVADPPTDWVDAQGRALGAHAQAPRARVEAPAAGLSRFARDYLAASPNRRAELLAVSRSASAATSTLSPDHLATPASAGPGPGCGAVLWTDSWKYNIEEHYMNVFSFGGAPATLKEGRDGSMTATLGVVAQAYNGALSASGSRTTTWSVSDTQTNLADAHVSNRVNYRKRVTVCSSYSQWLPYGIYDLITDVYRVAHTNYPYCSYKSAGAIFETSAAKNVTFSGGVSFPGLSVSAQSGYGSSQTLAFPFTTPGYICGNSSQGPASSPALSARV